MQRPVISVGNISVGGRGKTPTVAMLAKMLAGAGERPAILTRGYGRRNVEDGVVVVSDGEHVLADLDRSGDEPLLLARMLPGVLVLVSPDRVIAGTLAERVLGATIHVLDDGFQHVRLARDVDLVIVSPDDLEDRPMPFGRLREPLTALRSADAIIVDGPEAPGLDAYRSARAPVFRLERLLGEPEPFSREDGRPDRSASVLAVAGIASPDRFARGLTAAGWTVARSLAFPDHHLYGARDVRRIADAMHEAGAAWVLTTTKDAMRLLPRRPLPVPMAQVPLEVVVEPAEAFRAWLFGRINEARA